MDKRCSASHTAGIPTVISPHLEMASPAAGIQRHPPHHPVESADVQEPSRPRNERTSRGQGLESVEGAGAPSRVGRCAGFPPPRRNLQSLPRSQLRVSGLGSRATTRRWWCLRAAGLCHGVGPSRTSRSFTGPRPRASPSAPRTASGYPRWSAEAGRCAPALESAPGPASPTAAPARAASARAARRRGAPSRHQPESQRAVAFMGGSSSPGWVPRSLPRIPLNSRVSRRRCGPRPAR